MMDDATQIHPKWRLICEVVSGPHKEHYLPSQDLRRASQTKVDLRSAKLAGADLWESTLSYAKLQNSILVDVRSDNADLEGANPEGVDMRAHFSNANLIGATVDVEKLNEQVGELGGGTLPDGSAHA